MSVEKVLDSVEREKFSWQVEFHMFQTWLHAIWAVVIFLFAALSFMSGDGWFFKLATSSFMISSFCSLYSSRYHEFISSHKWFTSYDDSLLIRQKELDKTYKTVVLIAKIREWAVFIGVVLYIIGILMK